MLNTAHNGRWAQKKTTIDGDREPQHGGHRHPATSGALGVLRMRRVLLLLMLLAFVGGASAATLYVDTDGSGDYNCDGTNDHVEIQYAIDNSTDGDTVIVNASTYRLAAMIWVNQSNFTFCGDGMNDTVFVRSAAAIEVLVQVTNFTNAKDRHSWVYSNKDSTYWFNYPTIDFVPSNLLWNVTVRDFTIMGNGSAYGEHRGIFFEEIGDSDASQIKTENHWQMGVYIGNTLNMTVRECISKDDGQAITVGGAASAHYDNNIIIDTCRYDSIEFNGVWNSPYTGYPRPDSTCIGNTVAGSSAGGMFVYSTLNCNVSGNTASGSDNYGMKVSIASENSINNNILKDNTLDGLVFRTTNEYRSNNFTNNLIYNNSNYGIRLSQTDGSQAWLRGNITSNTIHGNAYTGIYNPYAEQDITIKNNIIVNNSYYGIDGLFENCSYNNVWNNTLGSYNNTLNGIGNISQNALFANSTGTDFHLKSTVGRWNGSAWVIDAIDSPCIDAGDPSAGYSAEPAPNGDRINMGAYGNTSEASKSGETYNVSGYVKHTNGTGIYNAYVTNNVTSSTNHSVTSGYYLLSSMGNHTYNVSASKTGFVSNHAITTVAGSDMNNVNLTLTEEAGWSPSIFGMYYNSSVGYGIEITTKGYGDRSNIFSRTPTESDGNATTSFKLVVTT